MNRRIAVICLCVDALHLKTREEPLYDGGQGLFGCLFGGPSNILLPRSSTNGRVTLKRAVALFRNDTYEEETYDDREGAVLGRVHITRSFQGDIEGRSTTELLTATTKKGSVGYVALDRVSGYLHGRKGSFVLQHHGTVSPGMARPAGSVVPHSGTAELRGLEGEAQILVDEDGRHRLVLEYELPD